MASKGEDKTGTAEYARFVTRVIKSYGKKSREGELDLTALTQLRELRLMLEEEERAVVAALRSEMGGAYSWQQIADSLGIAKSAAIRKYRPTSDAARIAGGQPLKWR